MIKAQSVYGELANEAYNATVQTILNPQSQYEYFSDLSSLKLLANNALKQIEHKQKRKPLKCWLPFKIKKSARRGSNPRPPPWQGGAPPLSHSRIPFRVI